MFYVINIKTNETLIMTTNETIAKQVAKFLNQPCVVRKSDC